MSSLSLEKPKQCIFIPGANVKWKVEDTVREREAPALEEAGGNR